MYLAFVNAASHSLYHVRIRLHTSSVLLTVALLVACGNRETSSDQAMSTVVETTVTAVEPTQSPTAKEKVGLGVPAALTTLEGFTLFGEPFDPLSLAQREVLLWFWAPW